jgi:hypothetical protein
MVALPISNSPTLDKISAAYEAARQDEERTYLGASTLGNECDRALWYAFRWASEPEQFDGRKLRLFETGHREELRMIDDLRRAGVTVEETDPETGRQWAIIAVNGHFRGQMARRNCRTCLSSTPVEGGFHCNRFKQVNDPHLQRKGCSLHLYIPALVPGEQVDVSEDGHQVSYKMRDGSAWVDGVSQ